MTGTEIIAAERQRQMEEEGWTPEHDDQHSYGEMAMAAMIYCIPYDRRVIKHPLDFNAPQGWPWSEEWYKPDPNNRIHELAKAGALIAAEIDRLQRKSSIDA